MYPSRTAAILALLTFLLLLTASATFAAAPAAAPGGRGGQVEVSSQGGSPDVRPAGRSEVPGGPVLPEAPYPVVLPLVGLAAVAGTLLVMRHRRGRAMPETDR